jgi:hypothetical protein
MNPVLSAGYCIMRNCNFNSFADADDSVILVVTNIKIMASGM